MPSPNSEPDLLLRTLDAAGNQLTDVRIHQMHALRHQHCVRGNFTGLRHIRCFLFNATRPTFAAGGANFTPAHFSETLHLLRHVTSDLSVIAAASIPFCHDFLSLGTNPDYTVAFIGEAPFFLELNRDMPRSRGENKVHLSRIACRIESHLPLIEVPPYALSLLDLIIGSLIAERLELKSGIFKLAT